MARKFKKNEYIVYGNSGVCLIEDVRNMKFGSEKNERMYYILRPVGNHSSTLYVPMDNEKLTAKMRDVLTKQQIDDMLSGIRDKVIDWQSDKKKRAEEFKQIMRDKNQEELLTLVGCIYMKKQELLAVGKKLNFTDENILQEAEKYIYEEFAFALDIPVCDVSDYIQQNI